MLSGDGNYRGTARVSSASKARIALLFTVPRLERILRILGLSICSRDEAAPPTSPDGDGVDTWTFVARAALLILAASAGGGCAPVVKRDLSHIPTGQVGFDDLCDLQTYFDGLATKTLAPPTLVSSSEVEKTAAGRDSANARMSGRSRFTFETDFQLQTIRRFLDQNWKRLPESLASAPRIDLEVWWLEKAGLRRVMSTEHATLIVARQSWALPYHVCLSELLFGEALYRQRREILVPTPAAPENGSTAERDGGTGSRDGGSSVNPDGGSG